MYLTKTQKVRMAWLKSLGLRPGVDFEVAEDGVMLFSADEFIAWEELASPERRKEIADLVELFGVGQVVEYDAETLSALSEDHIMGMVNPTISSNGQDDEILNEVLAAQLEATIEKQLAELNEEEAIRLAHGEVVMEPEAAREEPLFMITGTGATGVELSKTFRKAIANRVKEFFVYSDEGNDIPALIEEECLNTWACHREITRTHQRAAFAAKRYAAAVVRSLEGKAQTGRPLAVNTYWA